MTGIGTGSDEIEHETLGTVFLPYCLALPGRRSHCLRVSSPAIRHHRNGHAIPLCFETYGRKPLLMISILCYSILELLSGLAPILLSFLVLRALFGVAMGGEWGIGSSLTMESIPPRWRGWVSGLLQSGYPAGYFLATVAFYVVYPLVGWRGMFFCRRPASAAGAVHSPQRARKSRLDGTAGGAPSDHR